MDGSPLKPLLAIVVPCYNEEEVLAGTAKKLSGKLEQLVSEEKISEGSFLLFVDDGSKDKTWALIEKFHGENPELFRGIKLSKNRGQQNALLCGLVSVKNQVDAAISIDADLQDDIDGIDQMVEEFSKGSEIVYGVRSSRGKDGLFKKSSAQGFYKLMNWLGAEIVYNHADFRLMGKSALEALSEYNEVNLFLRGIVPALGFRTAVVYYERRERLAGTTKYPLPKMLKFSLDGVSSFSIKPLRLISLLGLLIFTISLVMIVYFFVRYFRGHTVTGWASIACSIWGIGGLILFSIGIVGEYIGKIYLETKQRPRYHVEKVLARPGESKTDENNVS